MFKKSYLGMAIATAIALPGTSLAELETSVVLKNETAAFTQSGIRTGEATTALDTTGEGKGVYKFENTAQVFLNGELGEESSWHGELKLTYDSKAIDDYKGHENYSQQDWLRELYVDTNAADWDLRLGKQQVVWGTADGIKLLDMINPTDWREFNQNAPADARIPIWMVNAEKYLDNGGNIQLLLTQAEHNKIPGLNADGDSGQPFVFKGVDTITGQVNGFLNIAPALGKVSNSFHNFATAGSFTAGAAHASALTAFTNLSVDGFAAQDWNVTFAGPLPLLAGTSTPSASNTASASNPLAGGPGTYSGNPLLNTFANDTASVGANSNAYITNLTNVTVTAGAADTVTWNPSNPVATFDHMPLATFATFNTFAGNQGTGGAIPSLATQYVTDRPDNLEPNTGFRYRNSTNNGINYSLNYLYHYDSNPAVDISYHDAVTGTRLTTELWNPANLAGGFATSTQIDRSSVTNAFAGTTVLLTDGTNYYGAVNPTTGAIGDGTHAGNGVIMRFTEYQKRIHSLGASFDAAIDAFKAPIVVRGEFLYVKDSLQPVVDKRLLAIGDLEGALKMEEADLFKYVIGIDSTVMTDMMISGQFIQFRNLDHIDESRGGCTTQFGSSFSCDKYTADFTSMSVTNSLKKAEKNKEFYSIFLSKPFGESGQGRWNNIFIYEEGGGKWNRFDVEYGVNDQLVVSAEYNKYFGDENTMFGQFENSSNVQLGVKWIME